MATPLGSPAGPARPRRPFPGWILLAFGLLAGFLAARVPRRPQFLSGTGTTRIDQATVLERLQSVASLVTTKVALRDVVTYENTRLGSTKRALVIVTGTGLVGFDLRTKASANVDHSKRVIEVTLPRARLVSVDVVRMTTYDESRGLWNPFYPADRDTIYQVARQQLRHAAEDLGVREHAEAGARAVFQALFASEGYEVRVAFVPAAGSELP